MAIWQISWNISYLSNSINMIKYICLQHCSFNSMFGHKPTTMCLLRTTIQPNLHYPSWSDGWNEQSTVWPSQLCLKKTKNPPWSIRATLGNVVSILLQDNANCIPGVPDTSGQNWETSNGLIPGDDALLAFLGFAMDFDYVVWFICLFISELLHVLYRLWGLNSTLDGCCWAANTTLVLVISLIIKHGYNIQDIIEITVLISKSDLQMDEFQSMLDYQRVSRVNRWCLA